MGNIEWLKTYHPLASLVVETLITSFIIAISVLTLLWIMNKDIQSLNFNFKLGLISGLFFLSLALILLIQGTENES